jgi:hypothetical protein
MSRRMNEAIFLHNKRDTTFLFPLDGDGFKNTNLGDSPEASQE